MRDAFSIPFILSWSETKQVHLLTNRKRELINLPSRINLTLNHQKKLLGDVNLAWNLIYSERNYVPLNIQFAEYAIGLTPLCALATLSVVLGDHEKKAKQILIQYCLPSVSNKPHSICEDYRYFSCYQCRKSLPCWLCHGNHNWIRRCMIDPDGNINCDVFK